MENFLWEELRYTSQGTGEERKRGRGEERKRGREEERKKGRGEEMKKGMEEEGKRGRGEESKKGRGEEGPVEYKLPTVCGFDHLKPETRSGVQLRLDLDWFLVVVFFEGLFGFIWGGGLLPFGPINWIVTSVEWRLLI